MIAEIIAVGNELLIEESLNQDYKVLVRQLAPLNIAIKASTLAGDSATGLRRALATAVSRSDVIFVIGGMDPKTKTMAIPAVSEAVGIPLTLHQESLAHIQRNLMLIMAGVADPRNMDYRFSQDETKALEEEIDRIENSFPRIKDFVLYGGCELSARLDVARAVTRRAERRFRKVEQNYGADAKAVQYINRLSDYLYMCARYADYKVENEKADGIKDKVVKNILGNM